MASNKKPQFTMIDFGDLDLADYVDLITFRKYLDESGRLATEILLAHIEALERPPQHAHLSDTIERKTA